MSCVGADGRRGVDAPFRRAAVAQPAQPGFRVSEDAAAISHDDGIAGVTQYEDALGEIIAADRAAIQGLLNQMGGFSLADRRRGGEFGILVEPAVQGGGADREKAGEIGIVHAEPAAEMSLASEVGFVAGRAGHWGWMRSAREYLN
ncbi:MAG: hypothetical protein ABIS51_09880 [Sphingomonas sp.]